MITEHILVVDDEENVCRSVKKILSRKGYSVTNASDAAEAVEKMRDTQFDLVITDLMMPKTSGLELLQIIRDHYPGLDVVMITGYATIESAVKAIKNGAAGYLPKPFTPEELTGITEKTLAEKKQKLAAAREHSAPAAAPAEPADQLLDVDLPFRTKELERATSREYVDALTHSDVPLATKTTSYCRKGARNCRRVVTEGRECAAECPVQKKEKQRSARVHRVRRSVEVIDADLPFAIGEVEQIAGADYISCLDRSDIPRAALYGRDATAKHSVLVVDDEPVVCQSVRRILSRQSCAVEEAFDVDVALRKLTLHRYDLVILDLKMPKRSGMELLVSVRRMCPDVPVLMVSGYATIQHAIDATRLGAFNVLTKPFTPEELVKVAGEALAA